MSRHTAEVHWTRRDPDFTAGRYSRAHEWRFDGGVVVPASASEHVVAAPWSVPANVDPEEAFIASVSSCHMLWFLSLAAEGGFVVDAYEDAAEGRMAGIAPRRQAIVEVVLRPRVRFDASHTPSAAELEALHHAAHERCFIANSIKSEVRIEPR